MQARRFTDIESIGTFIRAGNARMTLVSKITGHRFTYRIRQPEPGKPFFVSGLVGADNENDYEFFATIFDDGSYRHGRRARVSSEAQIAKAFAWFYKALLAGVLPGTLEVWHEGRCGRCGRVLTVPESIASGFGPECVGRIAYLREKTMPKSDHNFQLPIQ